MKRLLPIILAAYSGVASASPSTSPQAKLFTETVIGLHSERQLALCSSLEDKLSIETNEAYLSLFGKAFDMVAKGEALSERDMFAVFSAVSVKVAEASGYLDGLVSVAETHSLKVSMMQEQWERFCSEYGELP